jgi:UDP-N-acetyl-D-mannosaminuronic acid transferase (WecB/TagA/CpsF family)
MQRTGTERIYRQPKEPRRHPSRNTRLNARFLRLQVAERIKRAAPA